MFEHMVFTRWSNSTFGDWYIECRTEVGVTYGIGTCCDVPVGSTYETDYWKYQYKTWLSYPIKEKWYDEKLGVGEIITFSHIGQIITHQKAYECISNSTSKLEIPQLAAG